jgi:outer membrane protein OmpA-like peptidoglycan-associated protein
VDVKDLNDENSPKGLKAAVESEIILFELGQAEINPRQQQNLAASSQAIQKLLQTAPSPGGNGVIELVGHADSSGPEATNMLLSQERADNAVRALVRLGIPLQSLRATGIGLSSPLRPETDEQNRQYNRSVTFRVVSPETPQNR